MRNYIIDHWCGRLGLALSLFINGVAISVLLVVVAGVIEGSLPRPHPEQEFLWPWLVVFAVWLVWACVGIFRCGARYLLEREYGVVRRVGGLAAIAVVVVYVWVVGQNLYHLMASHLT